METRGWYGDDPRWHETFDAQAHRDFGSRLTISTIELPRLIGDPAAVTLSCGGVLPVGALPSTFVLEPYRLYRVTEVMIQGRIEPIEVTAVFEPYRWFAGDTTIHDGRFFPAVYADQYDESPHRFDDGSLCLYYPYAPVQRRWTPTRGLRSLVSLAADHIFFEDWHREEKEWIAPEAPHGFPEQGTRKAA